MKFLFILMVLSVSTWWQVEADDDDDDPIPTIHGWNTYVFRRDPVLPRIYHKRITSFQGDLKSNDLLRVAYKDSIKLNGFALIDIHTNARHNNTLQAYSAGWAEGFLTKDLIKHKIANSKSGHCPTVSVNCPRAYKFFKHNLHYMMSMINGHPTSPYWEQVRLILMQLQGLEDGYHGRTTINFRLRLDPFGLMALSNDHELEEILFAVGNFRKTHMARQLPLECSALVKLLPDNSDLYVGHATWRPFSTMLKIIKRYHFHFRRADGREYPGNKVAYTSEPGYLFSSNDWYIISSGLVTLETTIGNRNHHIARKYVKSEGRVLEWIRNLVANRLATDGKEWCEIFQKHNSGTYNNQWMIVDYNKFTPGTRPKSNGGLLYVLEQIPGLIHARDMTEMLAETTYWPSYNYPYFRKIQRRGGFLNSKGESDYNKLPRALIFARDQTYVRSLSMMFHLMRKNDYRHDPLSQHDPSKAIASRYDLTGMFSQLFGATDAKVTNYQLHKTLEMIAECGPTHDQVPPFKWSDHKEMGVKHEGMPNLFNFTPIRVVWLPL